MSSIIEVKNLHQIYGEKTSKPYEALKGINLIIEKGEFVAIMGPSGSGKSSLLNILATLTKPTSGEVQVAGKNILSLTDDEMAKFRGKELGFIFQEYNLIESLSVEENISLPLNLQNISPKKIKQEVGKVSALLNLENQLSKRTHELSGGQKQRVAAARALVHHPDIIFGDEPTGALDSENAREMMEYLSKINSEQNISILMVTHDAFSASFAQKIYFLADGNVVKTITRNNDSREGFYKKILSVLGNFNE